MLAELFSGWYCAASATHTHTRLGGNKKLIYYVHDRCRGNPTSTAAVAATAGTRISIISVRHQAADPFLAPRH